MLWKLFKKRPQLPKNYESLIDSEALDIIKKLQNAGYASYLVGGCVRDLLVGIPPKDFDIATSANPYRVKALIERSQIIGKRFRIVVARRRKVVHGSKQLLFPPLDRSKLFREFQITTFRRAPEKTLSGTLNENVFGNEKDDAERRDFTLNGLFFDPFRSKVVDYVGGEKDIVHKHIRTIGNPYVRFEEDPVRMLRAQRFALRLGFGFEKQTEKALKEQARFLSAAKRERTREEFLKMAREGYLCPFLHKTHESGLLRYASPGLDRFWSSRGNRLPQFLEKLDVAVKKYPWPNQHLSAPIFFMMLTEFNDDKNLVWHPELQSLKEDFLISKAEVAAIEGIHQLLNKALKTQRWGTKLTYLLRKNMEAQSQFFYVLKLLAETRGFPYDRLWTHNEDLWREMKTRHFSRRQ